MKRVYFFSVQGFEGDVERYISMVMNVVSEKFPDLGNPKSYESYESRGIFYIKARYSKAMATIKVDKEGIGMANITTTAKVYD